MSQQSTSQAPAASASNQSKGPKAGEYVIDANAISADTRKAIAEKLPGADVFPAKENGSYKGAVILADKEWLVQAVGKNQSTAVAHRREDVAIQGASLQGRDMNNDLEGRNVQVHYRGDKAKAYPWDAEKEAAQRAAAREGRQEGATERGANVVDKTRSAAEVYAKENFKTAKQRETFLNHVNTVLGNVDAGKGKADFSKAQAAPEKSQARSAEQTAER